MDKEDVKTDLIWILTTILVILLILFSRSCEKETTTKVNNDKEKACLKAEIKESEMLIDSLLMQVDSFQNEAGTIEVKIVKGKDVIKVLKEKVVVTDTLVIRYTEALETQLLDYDSLVTIQQKEIKTQGLIISEKDTIIVKTNKVLGLVEFDNENLQKNIKKKDRKIKLLKIERVLYPAAVLVGGIVLILKQ